MPEAPIPAAPIPAPSALILHLDGFEGPMDLLLELARGQKVDLARISILSLVEQYLAIIEGARRIRLELAADWLVMAAWLTWLKSRLLLPPDADTAEEGEEAAGLLAARLDALEHVQRAAKWLASRPQLGLEVFPRGAPEVLQQFDRSGLGADVAGLMRAYLAAVRRAGTQHGYSPRRAPMWTMADALARLARMLGQTAAWTQLDLFLPDDGPDVADDPVQWRAAIASTLLAGLELARGGAADLRQDAPFGPIMIRGA
jgi:segregation and condensation protein A